MYQEIRKLSEELRGDLACFTQQLIQISSSSFHEDRVAERVQQKFEEPGYDLVFRDDVGNVVGVLAGCEDGPTVLMLSHMDTVWPGNESAWTESPFSGRISNGRIYGLGANDCKGGLAAQVIAGQVLSRLSAPLYGTLVVAATVAEENGCGTGARHLLENTLPELKLKPSVAILGEPTSLALYVGHDGWAEVDVRVHGRDPVTVRKTCEASRRALLELSNEESLSGTQQSISFTGPVYISSDESAVATIRLCMRLNEDEDPVHYIDRIQHCVQRVNCGERGISIDVLPCRERRQLYTGISTDFVRCSLPWSIHPNEPVLDCAHDALNSAGWKDVSTRKWHHDRQTTGASGSITAGIHHIPTFGFGPGNIRLADTPDEYIAIDSLAAAAYGSSVLVHSLTRTSRYGWAISRSRGATGVQ